MSTIAPASVEFGLVTIPLRASGRLPVLALGAFLALLLPANVLAHAELDSSTPADGTTVPSAFEGPIVLTFSAALADGSKADLLGPDGAEVASAVVDGPGAMMTIAIEATLQVTLTPGEYEVRWVSVADDGDLERGTVTFTVASATATASPTEIIATPLPTVSPSAAIQTTAPVSPPPAASPSASADAGGDAGSSSADVILPIVLALVVVGAGAVYLLGRRNRPTPPR